MGFSGIFQALLSIILNVIISAISLALLILIFYFLHKKLKNKITNNVVRTILALLIADVVAILVAYFFDFLVYAIRYGGISLKNYFGSIEPYYYIPFINEIASLFNTIKTIFSYIGWMFESLLDFEILYILVILLWIVNAIIMNIPRIVVIVWIFVKYGLGKNLSLSKGGMSKPNTNKENNSNNTNTNNNNNVNNNNTDNSNVETNNQEKPVKKTAKKESTNNTDAAAQIKQYKELLDMGAITEEEYNKKKKELLKL